MTLAEILAALVKEYGLGRAGVATASTTVTLVDASNFSAPVSGGLFPHASPIRITSGNMVGQNVYKTNLDPATGTITFTPAITQPNPVTPSFVISHVVDHIDRLIEAVNRTLSRKLSRWQMIPLTYVIDGDLQGATVTDFWTVSSGAGVSYSTLAVPEGYERVLRLSHTGAATVTGEDIACKEDEEWEFEVYIRAIDETASIVWRDVVNSADITIDWREGTGSVTDDGWTKQVGTFTTPSDVIAPRLSISGTDPIGEMSPISARPVGAKRFPGQAHFKSVSNYGGLVTRDREPLRDDGLGWTDAAWGIGFHFQHVPDWPLYYMERLYYPELSTDAATTDADTEALLLGSAIEVWKLRISHENDKDRKAVLVGELADFEDQWKSPRIQKFIANRKVSVRRSYAAGVSA